MIDVCLLGTGGMMPLPYRALTALALRYNGRTILVDCGEGTQISMRQQGISFNPIDVVCFTHYHADHISGLPGLLLSMGNSDRTEPLTIIGPRDVERVVNSLRIIAPGLPFKINFIELKEDVEVLDILGLTLTAYRVNHSILCYGYSVSLKRAGKFDPVRAKELNIPVQYWRELQHGNEVVYEGETFTSDMVMGGERKGLKVTYCTDTRPVPIIEEIAKDSDLFICEGMYGDMDKAADARDKKHMMMQEACEIARKADVAEMWLTHYSPSMNKPQEYLEELRKLFPRVVVAKDRFVKELKFEES